MLQKIKTQWSKHQPWSGVGAVLVLVLVIVIGAQSFDTSLLTGQIIIEEKEGLGDVGITQQQKGGANTLEITTKDKSTGGQATRLLFRGGLDYANTEFYRGPRGKEQLSMIITGNGNVGIGTPKPQAKLHVNGAIIADDIITKQGSINEIIEKIESGAQAWKVDGDRTFIDSSEDEKVGIGTSNPQASLHIKKEESEAGIFLDSPNSASFQAGGGNTIVANLHLQGSQAAQVNFANNDTSAQWAIGLVNAHDGNFYIWDNASGGAKFIITPKGDIQIAVENDRVSLPKMATELKDLIDNFLALRNRVGEMETGGGLVTGSTANPYPISTNVILYQWAECDGNRNRNLIRDDEENMEIVHECMNYQPQVVCGANVLGQGSEQDTDGDGIKNSREYFMGLNPCEEYSVGGNVADGDFDYDGDGILNKDDDRPLCNPDGLYIYDCV